jgi:hypothetical protein
LDRPPSAAPPTSLGGSGLTMSDRATGETSCQVEHAGLVFGGQTVAKMDDVSAGRYVEGVEPGARGGRERLYCHSSALALAHLVRPLQCGHVHNHAGGPFRPSDRCPGMESTGRSEGPLAARETSRLDWSARRRPVGARQPARLDLSLVILLQNVCAVSDRRICSSLPITLASARRSCVTKDPASSTKSSGLLEKK